MLVFTACGSIVYQKFGFDEASGVLPNGSRFSLIAAGDWIVKDGAGQRIDRITRPYNIALFVDGPGGDSLKLTSVKLATTGGDRSLLLPMPPLKTEEGPEAEQVSSIRNFDIAHEDYIATVTIDYYHDGAVLTDSVQVPLKTSYSEWIYTFSDWLMGL